MNITHILEALREAERDVRQSAYTHRDICSGVWAIDRVAERLAREMSELEREAIRQYRLSISDTVSGASFI